MSHEQEIAAFRAFLEEQRAEDFDRTSAIKTFPLAPSYNFETFMNENIDEAAHRFQQGEDDPHVVLANDVEGRIFEAYHDETNMQFMQRIAREAKSMDAIMVFVAMMVWTANKPLDIDATKQAEVVGAIERGEVQRSYGWYAERSKHGEPRQRHSGFWSIEDDNELGELTIGLPEVAPLFHQILA